VKRWSKSSSAETLPMQRVSVQLFGIFVDSRPDYLKRGSNASELASVLSGILKDQLASGETDEWELPYFSLVCIEKLDKQLPSSISAIPDIWVSIVKLLAYPHPWVMQISSRILHKHLSSLDSEKLAVAGVDSFVVKIPGSLYDIARNLCRQMDLDDDHFVEATSVLAIKTVTWLFRTMKRHPGLCFGDDTQLSDDEEDNEDKPVDTSRDPCRWVMTRLSNIAKPRDKRRREAVFKCFAAMCASCEPEQLIPYLHLMIDPVDRAVRENASTTHKEHDPAVTLPQDVIQLLEDTCGTEAFLKSFTEVNQKVREKREQRKQEIATEKVNAPEKVAKRKSSKIVRNKARKKRKIDDMRSRRGKSRHP